MSTNLFPKIKHINDLLPHIAGNPQFRVAKQDNGLTVVCYMLQDEDTFSGENEEFAKECRGITFYEDGSVASRTLHKFQNVGENEFTQPDLIPWDRIVRIMDKRDGSMITPVLIDGQIVCKTKKTFTSAEAIEATKFLNADPKKVAWTKAKLESGFTPTFEWTSPRFPIVLTYDKDELTLLQIRDNVTGGYDMDLDGWDALIPFPIVENIVAEFTDTMRMEMGCFAPDQVSWSMLEDMALTRTGIEGVIIQADDGQMWKVKTKWYCDLHHSVTFTRWRDVAKVVIADQSDDLKAAFAMTGRSIEPILKVEKQVHHVITETAYVVDQYVLECRAKNMTVKDVAITSKGHPYFGQIMTTYRGGEVNWREWYAKHQLDVDWSLEVIPTAVKEEADVAE